MTAHPGRLATTARGVLFLGFYGLQKPKETVDVVWSALGRVGWEVDVAAVGLHARGGLTDPGLENWHTCRDQEETASEQKAYLFIREGDSRVKKRRDGPLLVCKRDKSAKGQQPGAKKLERHSHR